MPAVSSFEELFAVVPVMPIVTIADAGAATGLAHALMRGGIGAIEVTLRTPASLAAIAAIAREVPEITVGAGTVLSKDDLKRSTDAGARFAISPGATAELLAAGRAGGVPFLPGVATASEMQAAIDAGYTLLKFFPAAGAGGIAAMKAFAAPFPQLRFCATGGVTADTAQAWLDLPNVVAVGGSWIAPPELIARHEWNAIEARARDAATCFKPKPAR